MIAEISVGGVVVDILFKDIKNVHLSVYPPTGRVRISAPKHMSLASLKNFAAAKIGWIKKHQKRQSSHSRETPREYLERESHYVWGRRYLLQVKNDSIHPSISLTGKTLILSHSRASDMSYRQRVLLDWYRKELRERASPLVQKWSNKLGVQVDRFFIQQMKTKWGSSSPTRGAIRLNLELCKHNPEFLDYVVLHEIAHFVVPNHSDQFQKLLDRHMCGWRDIRRELNRVSLPLSTEN